MNQQDTPNADASDHSQPLELPHACGVTRRWRLTPTLRASLIGLLGMVASALVACSGEPGFDAIDAAETNLAEHSVTEEPDVAPTDAAPDLAEADELGDLEQALAPADYDQKCTHQSGFEICVSYNYTSRTAAANVQNETGGSRRIDLLLANPGGTLEQQVSTLGDGQWRGIYRSGVAPGAYCTFLFSPVGTQAGSICAGF